jgi:hypothetical protein
MEVSHMRGSSSWICMCTGKYSKFQCTTCEQHKHIFHLFRGCLHHRMAGKQEHQLSHLSGIACHEQSTENEYGLQLIQSVCWENLANFKLANPLILVKET